MNLRRSNESGCPRRVQDTTRALFVFCLVAVGTGLLSTGRRAHGGQAQACNFFGSDNIGNLFVIDLLTGAGTLIGTLPTGSTEIECDEGGDPDCFVQNPNGGLAITQFDITNGSGLGPTVEDGAAFNGLEYVDGVLYGTSITAGQGPSTLQTLDPFTGVATAIGLTGVGPISGLAFDTVSVSGAMYGIAGGPGPANLYTIDLATGVATVVGSTGIQAGSLDFGPDGILYAGGTGPDGGNFYRINVTTGASTLVGPTGFSSVTGLTKDFCTPIDTDGDEIPDSVETDNGLDPLDPTDAAGDLDADGLTNLEEFRAGTDMQNSDTDGDGISDADEIAGGTDPTSDDTDSDGLPDNVETDTGVFVDENDTGTDPLNPDTDDDGLLDGAEVAAGTDLLDPDTDGDGLLDGAEVAAGTDPLNPDTDGDGVLDGAEVAAGTDPLNSDTDGDGMTDDVDPFGRSIIHVHIAAPFAGLPTAPAELTLELRETDGSLIPEPLSFTLTTTGAATFSAAATVGTILSGGGTNAVVLESAGGAVVLEISDLAQETVTLGVTDSDGLGLTGADVELSFLDPGGDGDGDGVSNADEIAQGTDPLSADTDRDGLSDSVETNTGFFVDENDTGTDPLNPDTDGGGEPDGEEVVNGTDPHDPTDDLMPITLPTVLIDGIGFLWDIFAGGFIGDGTNDAFDGGLFLQVGGESFPAFADALTDDGGQTIIIEANVNGLEVTRNIFVPSSDEGFARYIEILRNTSAALVATTVRISGNLGSDSATQVIATSSSDTVFTTEDSWVVTDDVDAAGDPTMAFVIASSPIFLNPTTASISGDNFAWSFAVDVPAGETVAILHFAAQHADQATAVANATGLAELQGRALDHVSPTLRDLIVNFQEDSDSDGIPDPVEAANGLDPLDPTDAAGDLDGDGLTNLEEFEAGTNMQNPDTDGDGISDADEIAGGTDPTRDDTDRDGLPDNVETDTGVFVDENDTGTDPLNPDTDADGALDGAEVAAGTDLLDPDTDDDGLLDGAEVVAGADPLNPDTDGDSVLDGAEVAAGTDPLNSDTDGDGMTDDVDPFGRSIVHVHIDAPSVSLPTAPAGLTLELRETDGSLIPEPLSFTLTTTGAATFSAAATVGTIVSGGGTNGVVLESAGGAVALEISDLAQETVTLSVTDSDGLGLTGADVTHAFFEPDVCDLFGSDKRGRLFAIELGTGGGILIGTLPTASTEIECDDTAVPECFVQNPSGGFGITGFDLTSGAGLGPTVRDGASFNGLEYVDGVLYGTSITAGGGEGASTLQTLDPFTGVAAPIGLTGVGPIAGLAYDHAPGVMYGIAGGPGPADLYTINLATGIATVVGETSLQAGSLEFGPDGNLYAGSTGPDGGNLYRIDAATGASTLVGSTGFPSVTGLTVISCHSQFPGDCNQDGTLDLADALCLLETIFRGDPPDFPCGDGFPTDPANMALLDWQPDGAVDVSDAVSMLDYLFRSLEPHHLAVPGSARTGCVSIPGCPDNSASCP